MSTSAERLAGILVLAATLAAVLATPVADAARRSLRTDAGGWSAPAALGDLDCPGSYYLSSVVDWAGYRFQGHVADQSTFDEYQGFCQESLGTEFNQSAFGSDEWLLAAMVGNNDYAEVWAERYTFEPLDGGFQWVFYSFPRSPQRYAGDRVFVVAYAEVLEAGAEPPRLVIDPSVIDLKTGQVLFAVHRNGFYGDYLCFEGRILRSGGQIVERPEYIGTWSGEPGDEFSTCYQRLAHRLSFAPTAGEGSGSR